MPHTGFELSGEAFRRPYCESERVVSEGVVGEGDAMEWGVDKIRHDIGHEFV